MNEDVLKYSKKYVTDVLSHLECDPSVSVSYDDPVYYISIEGNDLNFLIGYRGTSLNGLQQLLALSVFREFGDWHNLMVDINGYREARKDKLEDMVKGFIDRARFFSKEVPLPPMSSFERKQLHEFISQYDDIESYSVGEGRDRHIVLKPV